MTHDNSIISELPPALTGVVAAMPAPPRARLTDLRAMILEAAQSASVGPVEETLKWGQPAFVPPRRVGTTIRLGWTADAPDHCALLVHCQTDLVDRWRLIYGAAFDFDGRRAVLLPVQGAMDWDALRQMAQMALTYHRDKRRRAQTAHRKEGLHHRPCWCQNRTELLP